jgi:hypothetical protein
MPEYYKNDAGPLVHVHFRERAVTGNGIAIKVYGEVKIAAHEKIYAKDLGLNTITVLTLTPYAGNHGGYIANNWIYHKGEYGNYASVDILTYSGTCVTAGNGPYDGSLWLNFIAVGE